MLTRVQPTYGGAEQFVSVEIVTYKMWSNINPNKFDQKQKVILKTFKVSILPMKQKIFDKTIHHANKNYSKRQQLKKLFGKKQT